VKSTKSGKGNETGRRQRAEEFDPCGVGKDLVGIESPGFYPGLFGLDPFGVLWILAFAGMTIFHKLDPDKTIGTRKK
jgi:hypothetical protein